MRRGNQGRRGAAGRLGLVWLPVIALMVTCGSPSLVDPLPDQDSTGLVAPSHASGAFRPADWHARVPWPLAFTKGAMAEHDQRLELHRDGRLEFHDTGCFGALRWTGTWHERESGVFVLSPPTGVADAWVERVYWVSWDPGARLRIETSQSFVHAWQQAVVDDIAPAFPPDVDVHALPAPQARDDWRGRPAAPTPVADSLGAGLGEDDSR